MERGWQAWLGLLWAVLISWYAIDAQRPPDARPADAPAEQFSAARAMRDVEAIAQKPHPTDSPEAERVREVIVDRLKALGLEPEIQVLADPEIPVRNIVARLRGKGSAGKKAILLCAHYDSVESGPGAGDDASGVAVVLETLRAVQAGPPLERDVIVLIDDCEEQGLHGARLFVGEHRWAKDVGVVLNFDARGNSGPSFMFETSAGNSWLIDQFARATPHPLATSVSMDVYRIMPNDSNLTIFKQAGMAGLNYAFAGGVHVYHTADDTPANLSLATLQHQGENCLAMTRRLGMLDLDDRKGNDVVYTSILNRFVVAYPVVWAMPLAAGAAALFVVVAGLGLARARVRLGDLVAGAGAWMLATWLSILGIAVLWAAMREALAWVGVEWGKLELPIMGTCAAFAAALTLSIERRSYQLRPLVALGLGAQFWWVLLALSSAWWLPGSSYVFAWPAWFGLLGLGAAVLAPAGSRLAFGASLLCSVPVLVVMPPLIYNTFMGLGVRLAGPSMVLVTLFLGAILPLLGAIVTPSAPDRAMPPSPLEAHPGSL